MLLYFYFIIFLSPFIQFEVVVFLIYKIICKRKCLILRKKKNKSTMLVIIFFSSLFFLFFFSLLLMWICSFCLLDTDCGFCQPVSNLKFNLTYSMLSWLEIYTVLLPFFGVFYSINFFYQCKIGVYMLKNDVKGGQLCWNFCVK